MIDADMPWEMESVPKQRPASIISMSPFKGMWVIQLVDSIKIDWEPPDTTGSGIFSSLLTFHCLEINLLGVVAPETLAESLCNYLREWMRPEFSISL